MIALTSGLRWYFFGLFKGAYGLCSESTWARGLDTSWDVFTHHIILFHCAPLHDVLDLLLSSSPLTLNNFVSSSRHHREVSLPHSISTWGISLLNFRVCINNLIRNFLLIAEQRRRWKSGQPVFVPEARQHLLVNWRFVERSFQLIILVIMRPKLFNLVQRHTDIRPLAPIFAHLGLDSLDVLVRVSPETSDLYFACTHGPFWINHDSNPRALFLKHRLRSYIYSW